MCNCCVKTIYVCTYKTVSRSDGWRQEDCQGSGKAQTGLGSYVLCGTSFECLELETQYHGPNQTNDKYQLCRLISLNNTFSIFADSKSPWGPRRGLRFILGVDLLQGSFAAKDKKRDRTLEHFAAYL
jgi:hypothetical protein